MPEIKSEDEVNYYELVRRKLNLGPIITPKHEKVIELLKIFWDEETVKLLSNFPNAGYFISISELMEKTGLSKKEIKRILKKATKKKTISRSGNKFSLEPLVPSIFEAYYYARPDTEENIKKASEIFWFLFKNQKELRHIDENFTFFRPLLPIESKEKLIKIDESVNSQSQVMPYELVEDLINNSDYFTVIPCPCRYIGEVSGEPCEIASSDLGCFVTGGGARAIAEFGWGKALTKEEAIEYLKKTEKAGLVHCTSNSKGGEHLGFICNCCPCHCGALHPTKVLQFKTVTPSNFQPKVNSELCIPCAVCRKKCPMNAISLEEGSNRITINYNLCIGCGLCATNCPRNAIILEKVRQKVPPDVNKLGNRTFQKIVRDLVL
ncbi:MAG: 4Fe-4S binding protein [Candidatus Helarchaeota archaeon]